jgi:hypothetical protein
MCCDNFLIYFSLSLTFPHTKNFLYLIVMSLYKCLCMLQIFAYSFSAQHIQRHVMLCVLHW